MHALRPMPALVLLVGITGSANAQTTPPTQGMLQAVRPDSTPAGPCPLKHTDVAASISGFVARVEVTQTFHNPFPDKIEAVYVFPLSQDAAVDDMVMTVGDRTIRGLIKPREEAREIYDAARRAGHVAGLLDQERPNIFTQSVANIEPGEEVRITIRYVEMLDWEDGTYSFDFPMVVGPRYIPGQPVEGDTGRPAAEGSGTGWSPDTNEVPDASKITPPVTPEGTRSGHDIRLAVEINAGLPIQAMESKQHGVDVAYAGSTRSAARVTLKGGATIPNKDFVLTFRTATETIEDALLVHTDERGRFFTLVLQPPTRVPPEWIVPKEMIFVIDKSGSMSGFPIETAKATMQRCIENLNPDDTFNLMTFSGGTAFCFPASVANTTENRAAALSFLKNLQGSGGTEMMQAVHAALGGPKDPQRVRVVCFMTDGYVGNDAAIIDAVQKNADVTRVFSFGIGRSVNRYLLDGMARAGRGDVEYVLDERHCSDAAERFYDRVTTPVLTDVQIDWGGLPVSDLYPRRIPDLFSAKPVVIQGRYERGSAGRITLKGRRGRSDFAESIDLALPDGGPGDAVIASLWARAKVEDLMNQDLVGAQQGQPDAKIKEEVVALGMNYRLLTAYTSFVAVEEMTITRGGEARKVAVPVEMPEGVSYKGVFGEGVGVGGASAGVQIMSGAPIARAGKVMASAGRPAALMPAGESALGDAAANRRAFEVNLLEAIAKDPQLSPEEKRSRTLEIKLHEKLRKLADRVGTDGSLSDGPVQVKDGKVEVAVYLRDAAAETLETLKALGFEVLLQTKSVNMVIGVIDVAKLDELTLLDVVRRVEPPNYGN